MVKEPSGTVFNTPHAANYFRPNEVLRSVPDAEPWQPGDILIYWDGDLLSHRLLHVNLYVGPFAGVDLDGRVYAQDQPCDVVNASIDYRDRRGQEVGTRIRGLTKDNCLQTKLGRKNIMRLRHMELDGQPQAGVPMVGHDDAAVATEPLTAQPTTDNDFIVPAGQLTFDAEGQEVRGLFFSRKPHVPSNSSGVTLGRGYDMKMKTRAKIIGDLTNAGIDGTLAERFAGAVGLQGRSAKQYLHDQGLDAIEITPAQQKPLFLTTYEEHAADVKRICATNTVVGTYGRTAWDQLHPAIQDVVVDLRYRGDYTPNTRQRVQPLMVASDLSGMARVIGDKAYWQNSIGVPRDRFERRADYMARALHAVG